MLAGLILIPADQAGSLIVRIGYYATALNFILLVAVLAWNPDWTRWLPSLREHAPGLLICLALTILTHVHEPHGFKVLQDEFALLNNSMSMHFHNRAGLIGMSLSPDWQWMEPITFSADKRTLFFQYLLSLVHDVSGYRPANAFILNFVVTGGFFLSLYAVLSCLLKTRLVVYSGLILAASIPLLAQIATSGGYDLLNVTMILVFMLAGLAYWRNPEDRRQNVFVLVALLLAQTRYESILYLAALGSIVAITWWRKKTVRISRISAFSPVFLLMPLLANAYMTANESLQDASVRVGGQPFMGVHYIMPNIQEALFYFFQVNGSGTNSVVVSTIMVLGLAFIFAAVVLRRGSFFAGQPEARIILCLTLPVVIACFLIMTANFWGVLTDYQASRFAIPVYILGLVCGLLMLDEFLASPFLRRSLLIASVALLSWSGIPKAARAETTGLMTPSIYHNWILEFAGNVGESKALFSCDKVSGLITHGHAALHVGTVNDLPGKILEMLGEEGIFEALYTFEIQAWDNDAQQWVGSSASVLLDKEIYLFEQMATRDLQTGHRGVAYKVTGMKVPASPGFSSSIPGGPEPASGPVH
jgi:hypothetical protein